MPDLHSPPQQKWRNRRNASLVPIILISIFLFRDLSKTIKENPDFGLLEVFNAEWEGILGYIVACIIFVILLRYLSRRRDV